MTHRLPVGLLSLVSEHSLSSDMILNCGSRTVDLSTPKVMGVLNVTPDSFYDGGKHYGSGGSFSLDSALRSAEKMVAEGACFIDIGGESTRPGAVAVSVQQESERVLPVVEALAGRIDAVISVDTSTPELMREAVSLGAGFINDVRALERDGAIEAALIAKVPVCLMHMQGKPRTMQDNPAYQNVTADVLQYLLGRVEAIQSYANAAGLAPAQIVFDPGFGFGKTDAHNLQLLKNIVQLTGHGYPVLAGLSRKSMIGRLLQREPDERLAGSLALAIIALQNGASIIRAHDVAETSDVITLTEHVKNFEE